MKKTYVLLDELHTYDEKTKKGSLEFIESVFTSKSTKEAEINGEIVKYDFCSTNSLEQAKEYSKNFAPNYLGSGKVIYINGKKNVFDELHHFFSR